MNTRHLSVHAVMLFLLLAGLTTSLGVGASSTAEHTVFLPLVKKPFKPLDDPIAFHAAMEEQTTNDIYLIDSDGGTYRRLTFSPADDVFPGWSPDGSKIVFVSNRGGDDIYSPIHNLYTINPDGSAITQLTDLVGWASAPSWSPDGSKIAFSLFRWLDYQGVSLFVINADGSGLAELAHESSYSPSWSPDGSQIAYCADVDTAHGTFTHIHVMDADGGNKQQITSGDWDNMSPHWSPLGDLILFTTDRRQFDEIYTIKPDGSDETRLTDSTVLWSRDIGRGWSPDGSRILFARYTYDSGAYQLFTMTPDGSDLHPVTDWPDRGGVKFGAWGPAPVP